VEVVPLRLLRISSERPDLPPSRAQTISTNFVSRDVATRTSRRHGSSPSCDCRLNTTALHMQVQTSLDPSDVKRYAASWLSAVYDRYLAP
jgi:hypothetical protein